MRAGTGVDGMPTAPRTTALIGAMVLLGMLVAGAAHASPAPLGAAVACALEPGETSASVAMIIQLVSPAVAGGPQIMLGDIAQIHVADESLKAKLERVEVAPAPLPGAVRRVNIGQIQVRMRQRRLDPAMFTFVGPPEVTVEAATLLVEASAVERAATQALIASADYVLSEQDVAVVRNDAPQGARVSLGSVRLDARVAAPGADGVNPRADVKVLVDGTLMRTVSVWLRITAAPVVVRQSDVALVVDTGGVRVAVPAVALEDGRPGQRIKVRNTASGVEVVARVVDCRTVRAIIGTQGGQTQQ